MSVDRQLVESLLVEARRRPTSALSARERRYELTIGLAFVAVVAAMIAFLDGGVRLDVPVAIGLVAAHVVAQRVEFEIGAGMTNATELVLVPMLLLLPVTLVPVAVAVALVARAGARVRHRSPPSRAAPAGGPRRVARGRSGAGHRRGRRARPEPLADRAVCRGARGAVLRRHRQRRGARLLRARRPAAAAAAAARVGHAGRRGAGPDRAARRPRGSRPAGRPPAARSAARAAGELRPRTPPAASTRRSSCPTPTAGPRC